MASMSPDDSKKVAFKWIEKKNSIMIQISLIIPGGLP